MSSHQPGGHDRRRRWFDLARFDLAEQLQVGRQLVRWTILGAIVGVLAGVASAGFLRALDEVTEFRVTHPAMLFALPLAGLLVGLVYDRLGGRSAAGNNLLLDEIHEPVAWVPRRMAPLILVTTLVTHLFGGSAGREGTAIQMSGSLTDWLSRTLRLGPADRRLMLITSIAAGFGSVFGVPFAGCVFALEVQAVGRIRHDALVPALAGSIVGDLVVRGLGVDHRIPRPLGSVDLDFALAAKIALAGIAFGLVALAFSEITHGLKQVFARSIGWPPLRPFVGGLIVVALTFVVGSRDYLGLSLPLIYKSLAGGVGVIGAAFALKVLFTAVTLGSGFQGGEVTPLFVIGSTLGAALGRALGAPIPLFAALGLVAVFGAASNTPLASTVMGIELFGAGPTVALAMACTIAYVCSSHRGIYGSQRLDTPKATGLPGGTDGQSTVGEISDRRSSRRRRD